MYKSAIRVVSRRTVPSQALFRTSNRYISTAPPARKSRSWKSSAARLSLAAGGLYYYNTSNLFAEEPEAAIDRLEDSVHAIKESNLPTLDAIVEEKRARQAQNIAEEQKREREARAALTGDEEVDDEEGEGGISGLEQEAGQQGAFNEETGEINWDCPCLGGMAHGPCGDEFKEAFSCFVYSKEEPKGIECIDKFKGMQDCFRQHPETYASELADDDAEDDEDLQEEIRARDTTESKDRSQEAPDAQAIPQSESSKPIPITSSEPTKPEKPRTTPEGIPTKAETGSNEHGDPVPKSAHAGSQ